MSSSDALIPSGKSENEEEVIFVSVCIVCLYILDSTFFLGDVFTLLSSCINDAIQHKMAIIRSDFLF